MKIECVYASEHGYEAMDVEEFRKQRASKGIIANVYHIRDAKSGTKYAILTTEAAPKPDKNTGRMATEEEQAKWQHAFPIMNEILQEKGLVKVAQGKILVTCLKGAAGRRLAEEGGSLCLPDSILTQSLHTQIMCQSCRYGFKQPNTSSTLRMAMRRLPVWRSSLREGLQIPSTGVQFPRPAPTHFQVQCF